MTTNHKDRLDPALIRPGRVDREFYLDNCNEKQSKEIFNNFFPEATEGDLQKLLECLSGIECCLSPAKLQGHLLRYKGNLVDSLTNFHFLGNRAEESPATPGSVDSGCLEPKEQICKMISTLEQNLETE